MSCYRCFHNRWGKGGEEGNIFWKYVSLFRFGKFFTKLTLGDLLLFRVSGCVSRAWSEWLYFLVFFSAASFFRKCRGREGCNGGKFVLLKNDPWRIPAARTRRAIFLPFFVSSFLLSSRNDQTTERERETTEEEEEKAHCHVLWGALIATSCSFLPPLKMAPSTSPKSPPNAIRKGSSFGGILWANFGDSLHETKAGWSILSDQFTSSRS